MTTPLTIAVWDNIGNVLLGVRLEKGFGDGWQDKLVKTDPAAIDTLPEFSKMFVDYDVTLHEVHTLAELDAVIADVDYLVIHKERLTPEVLAKGKKIRLLQHLGEDHRGVPMDVAKSMNIPVCATPLINYIAVAEHAWTFVLNYYKQMQYQRAQMEQRLYIERGWGATVPNVRIVQDYTLGLLGFGEIARPMARYAHAFEMPCIYWDKVRFPELEAEYHIKYVEWDELWQQSDVLSVHIPIMPETQKIIGAREIGMMKSDAFFINTARGKLVDQPALVDALINRRIGGAGLDVMYEEPLPPNDILHALNSDPTYNVTLTSHSAWQGPWTWVRDSLNIWDNVIHHLHGEPMQYQVSP
ncbi:MAG: NAD(P)-dependent oxidoreductase [Chloroflexota bacterium]